MSYNNSIAKSLLGMPREYQQYIQIKPFLETFLMLPLEGEHK